MRIAPTRDDMIALTPLWTGERFDDGRPRVPDDVLAELRQATTEEAWGTMLHAGYPRQFASPPWLQTHPGTITVGRAITAQFVPHRPDFDAVVVEAGAAEGHEEGDRQNSWVIEALEENDIMVVDIFGKVIEGTVIGDNLGTAVASRTKVGAVINGGVRDLQGLVELEGVNFFYRGADPTPIRNVTLAGINLVDPDRRGDGPPGRRRPRHPDRGVVHPGPPGRRRRHPERGDPHPRRVRQAAVERARLHQCPDRRRGVGGRHPVRLPGLEGGTRGRGRGDRGRRRTEGRVEGVSIETPELASNQVSGFSAPTELRITDLRVVSLVGVPFPSTIIRLDTNQGISGYGEVRDGASRTYALELKSRLIGENPCNVDKIFRKIKQFGGHSRRAGGVCGVEMALMDLAGKAYGVPAYALVGGRFRDQVMCYADTPSDDDPVALGEKLLERRSRGFTMLKVDLGVDLLWDIPGALIAPPYARETTTTMHPFAGIQVTQTGIDYLVEFMATLRGIVGYDVALATDHFGHIALDSCIRVARALEPFTLAWVEDMIPWQYTDQWRQLTTSITTPTCTGEDIYLAENFRPLIEAAGGADHPPRPGHLGRDQRDEAAGRLRPGTRRGDGVASGREPDRDHGERPPGRGDGELHRPRAPRRRRRAVERTRRGPPAPVDPERRHRRPAHSRDSGSPTSTPICSTTSSTRANPGSSSRRRTGTPNRATTASGVDRVGRTGSSEAVRARRLCGVAGPWRVARPVPVRARDGPETRRSRMTAV